MVIVNTPVGAVELGFTTPAKTIVTVCAGMLPLLALNPLSSREVELGWLHTTAVELMLTPVRVAQLLAAKEAPSSTGKLILIRPELEIPSSIDTANV